MKFSDRKRLDEGRSHLRRNDILTVGFTVVGGELRQELIFNVYPAEVEAVVCTENLI